MEANYIKQGDCLELMKELPDKSIDLILCDLPYGTTACKWDTVISYELLWEQYNRITKDNAAIVLFGNEPFTTELRHSQLNKYKYDWKWIKNAPTGFQTAKLQPLRKYEDIAVFSKGTIANCSKNNMKFFPQGIKVLNVVKKVGNKPKYIGERPNQLGREYISEFTDYPDNILFFEKESSPVHPTQKPVELLEYLIKTYTKENEVVLDNCMGSGSTCVACVNTKRQYIGFEKEQEYFEIAKKKNRRRSSLS